ncbi:Prp18 domain-containing protein [Coniella lustricola]|uniref:Pre-mRNA-splicing factor 18 n=1 Tax=Coniella lustricola TaxID=2025994 RepID=A0A2T3AND2_9PEZI|nr:Prp18 domain-containing protein [Coniella lustricola]
MDFAALMSKEISKKKQGASSSSPTKTTTTSANPSSDTTAKNYIRKGDAEAARRAAYLAEQDRLEQDRLAKAAAKRKREEDAAIEVKAREEKRRKLADESRRRKEEKDAEEERARRKRLGLPEVPAQDETQGGDEDEDDDKDDVARLSEEEVTAKMRSLGEPVTLFGESLTARRKRLRRLTTAVTQGPIPTSLQLVEEQDMKVSEMPAAKDKAARKYLYRQLASYFTMVLREWEMALAREQQSAENADSVAARQAYNAMVQCKQTMTPLFRKFEKDDLDESVLKSIVEIVKSAQERRYVDANDEYLRLSIGKAAWPIGVTMVGIHERSAREKLHDGERGHVMGDEVTRKYLQSIKRCLTFAQVRWPPEDIRQLMG